MVLRGETLEVGKIQFKPFTHGTAPCGGREGGDLCAKEGQSVRGEFTLLQVNAHSVLCSLLTVQGGVGGLLIFCTESNHNMILRKETG